MTSTVVSDGGEDSYDVVIVGAGPAGLAAAWRLRSRRILVLEAAAHPGGRLKSIPRDPYWINLGGHLVSGGQSQTAALLRELDLPTLPIPGSKIAIALGNSLHVARRPELYPFLLPLTWRERLAFIRAGLLIRLGAAGWQRAQRRRAGESPRAQGERLANFLADRTLAEYLGPLPGSVDAIFRSAARRAAAEPEVQSAGVGVSLFGAVSGSGAGTLALNIDGGSGRLPQEPARRLRDALVCDAPVRRVTPVEDGYVVSYSASGKPLKVRTRRVVMAVPAPTAAEIVEGLDTELKRALRAVTAGPFLSMGILTTEAVPMPWDGVYAVTTPYQSFDMLFNHANPLRTGRRRPGGSLMVYAGGQPAAEMMELSDEEIVRHYLADLIGLLPQLEGAIAETVVQRWPAGNVYRRPGSVFTPVLDHAERPDAAIQFCGDYFGVIGNIEVAVTSGIEAAERVRASLA